MDEAVSHLWPKAEVSIPIRLLAVPTVFKTELQAVAVNLRYLFGASLEARTPDPRLWREIQESNLSRRINSPLPKPLG